MYGLFPPLAKVPSPVKPSPVKEYQNEIAKLKQASFYSKSLSYAFNYNSNCYT